MQLTKRPQLQPSTRNESITFAPQSSKPSLFARWEVVNGKLTCRWLQQPD